jgi:hypothetical protein
MNSGSLCSLAGRYDNPIPPRFLAPIDFLKIPARYDNPIPTRFLGPIDCSEILALGYVHVMTTSTFTLLLGLFTS